MRTDNDLLCAAFLSIWLRPSVTNLLIVDRSREEAGPVACGACDRHKGACAPSFEFSKQIENCRPFAGIGQEILPLSARVKILCATKFDLVVSACGIVNVDHRIHFLSLCTF